MKKKQIFCGVLGLLIVSSLAACNSQATPPNESTSPLPAVVGNEELNGSYENESASGDNVEVTAAGIAQTYVIQDNTPQTPVSYSQYEAFGLQYDESKNELYFDGELVRYFYDGVKLSDGAESVYCDFLNEQGTVDVHTIREEITNKDGSTDPFGELIGIERYSQEEFNNRDLSNFYGSSEAITYSFGTYDPSAKTFSETFEKYSAFGIEYVEAENASGAGNVYYNGQLVNSFVDSSPNGGTFSFHSADGGKINVRMVYDADGNLTGVKQTN